MVQLYQSDDLMIVVLLYSMISHALNFAVEDEQILLEDEYSYLYVLIYHLYVFLENLIKKENELFLFNFFFLPICLLNSTRYFNNFFPRLANNISMCIFIPFKTNNRMARPINK